MHEYFVVTLWWALYDIISFDIGFMLIPLYVQLVVLLHRKYRVKKIMHNCSKLVT